MMVKCFSLTCAVFAAFFSGVAIAGASDYTISSGEKIEFAEGLSIAPPAGWEVYREYPNLMLLFQAPKDKKLKYRRTLQGIRFKGSQYIDELAAEKFETVIVDKYSRASPEIRNYRVRNRIPVTLDSGVDGFLFYTEFDANQFEIMQMHVLVSSADKHFLLTFTDLAEYFDPETIPDEDHLNEAWEAFGSIELDSSGPSRLALPIGMFVAVAFILIFGPILFYFRAKLSKKKYDDFADGNYVPEEGDEEDLALTRSPESINTIAPYETIHEANTVHEDEDEEADVDFDDEKAI